LPYNITKYSISVTFIIVFVIDFHSNSTASMFIYRRSLFLSISYSHR